VIVNVTGGPDLSMIEVSEATSIIYEAAHEDANIIFGAVVDPSMEGRVKITVIATGFGKAGADVQPAAASVQTPVDLQNYTEWQSDEPMSQAVGGHVPITRRPVVGLPALSPAPLASDDGERLELDTSLETPAFLRRPGN